MSLKKIEQVKQDRGFKLFDIIIYGAVVLIVAVLFIVLFTTQDKSSLSGIRIMLKAQVVFEYEFGGDDPLYIADCVTLEEKEHGFNVIIENDGDKNVIFINTDKNTVKMVDANCRGKQCMYFAAMDDNSDFIYCSPHGIKLEPLKMDFDSPVIPFG